MLTAPSVAFVFLVGVFCGRRFPGFLLTGIGLFCGLWFRFRVQGHLCLRCCALCTADGCEDYGRLEGTKSTRCKLAGLSLSREICERGQNSCRQKAEPRTYSRPSEQQMFPSHQLNCKTSPEVFPHRRAAAQQSRSA